MLRINLGILRVLDVLKVLDELEISVLRSLSRGLEVDLLRVDLLIVDLLVVYLISLRYRVLYF